MAKFASLGFVVNPHAGPKKSRVWREEITSTLDQAGIRHEIAETENITDVGAKVREFASRNDAVFAVGGDGTAHHVAQGLAGGDVPFGLLPNGSGNDYSRMLGMPKGVRSGLEQLLKASKITPYSALQLVVTDEDSGRQLTRWSINTAGFGFDAAVSEMKTRIPVLRGLPLYLTSSLLTLLTYRASTLSTDLPDATVFKGLMVAAGVGEFEGGGFRIFPGASPLKDTFQVCEIREKNGLKALPLLIQAVSGSHVRSRRVAMREVTSIGFRSDTPIPMHADGEVVTLKAKEVQIRLVSGALKVLIPA